MASVSGFFHFEKSCLEHADHIMTKVALFVLVQTAFLKVRVKSEAIILLW